ncbi:MAG: hypothetical protein KDB90_15060 [Planctomycetes bacterium]|nr:hypothetical protein [Planctomycetota bacterium]
MTEAQMEDCVVCGNHAVETTLVDGEIVKECEVCGNLSGSPEVVELMELQREAEGLGVSIYSFPLAQFIDGLPGVKLQGDSGGERSAGRLPFIAFELIDHRSYQLENIGQSLRLLRGELECEWKIEFTFEYELGFELRPRGKKEQPLEQQVEAARRDMIKIWRRLQSFKGLAWWKQ